MKTAKQREHQRERAKRKKLERWAKEVEAPMIVTMMLLGGYIGAWATGWMAHPIAYRAAHRAQLQAAYKPYIP